MRTGLIIACVWMIALSAGCAAKSAPNGNRPHPSGSSSDPAGRWSGPAVEINTSNRTYVLIISPPPATWPSNQLFELTVRALTAADRSPAASDVTLTIDAAMPAHRHGMTTRPKTTSEPGGAFTVRGMNLHMSGEWEIYFDVTRAGITERGQLSVTID